MKLEEVVPSSIVGECMGPMVGKSEGGWSSMDPGSPRNGTPRTGSCIEGQLLSVTKID